MGLPGEPAASAAKIQAVDSCKSVSLKTCLKLCKLVVHLKEIEYGIYRDPIVIYLGLGVGVWGLVLWRRRLDCNRLAHCVSPAVRRTGKRTMQKSCFDRSDEKY